MVKIKVPKEIKIGVSSTHIERVENLHGDEGWNGTYNRRTGLLQIDSRLQGVPRDRTFGHELNEMIKDNYELEVSERDMSCIANGWMEFLAQLGIELDWSEIKELSL